MPYGSAFLLVTSLRRALCLLSYNSFRISSRFEEYSDSDISLCFLSSSSFCIRSMALFRVGPWRVSPPPFGGVDLKPSATYSTVSRITGAVSPATYPDILRRNPALKQNDPKASKGMPTKKHQNFVGKPRPEKAPKKSIKAMATKIAPVGSRITAPARKRVRKVEFWVSYGGCMLFLGRSRPAAKTIGPMFNDG